MNSTNRKKELKALYKKWPEVRRFLKTLGCSTADAEDIFQEALVLYCRKCEEKDFQLEGNPFHYVKGICKFLWYNQSRKQKHHSEIKDDLTFSNDDEEWLEKEMRLRFVEDALAALGEKCRELLTSFYGLGLSMVAIAKKLGLRNEKVAKSQKYRCLQKAKEIAGEMQQQPIENF